MNNSTNGKKKGRGYLAIIGVIVLFFLAIGLLAIGLFGKEEGTSSSNKVNEQSQETSTNTALKNTQVAEAEFSEETASKEIILRQPMGVNEYSVLVQSYKLGKDYENRNKYFIT